MTKIVSRTTTDFNVMDLQEILADASEGMISTGGRVEPGATIQDLVTQTASLFEVYRVTLAFANTDVARLTMLTNEMMADNIMLAQQMDGLLDVNYDEALEHATLDLMDGFCASGAADVSADGELVFDERVTFTKEDLKPILREAITRWVECRLT